MKTLHTKQTWKIVWNIFSDFFKNKPLHRLSDSCHPGRGIFWPELFHNFPQWSACEQHSCPHSWPGCTDQQLLSILTTGRARQLTGCTVCTVCTVCIVCIACTFYVCTVTICTVNRVYNTRAECVCSRIENPLEFKTLFFQLTKLLVGQAEEDRKDLTWYVSRRCCADIQTRLNKSDELKLCS